MLGAAERFDQAAQAGDTNGMVNHADLLMRGGGVEKDELRAVELYRQAAKQGNGWGMYHLAALLEEGRVISQDKAQAISLLQVLEQDVDASLRAAAQALLSRCRQ